MGQQQFQDATGRVSVGTVINLKTVEIGGIVLHDVEATVVDNIQAPLLLGQTALAKFGKISIDYDNKDSQTIDHYVIVALSFIGIIMMFIGAFHLIESLLVW